MTLKEALHILNPNEFEMNELDIEIIQAALSDSCFDKKNAHSLAVEFASEEDTETIQKAIVTERAKLRRK